MAPSSKLVEPKPLGPLGLPLPRTDNSVTWALLDDNKTIRSGLAGEGGTLRLYNYADYINPGTVKKFEKQFNCKVQIATYNSADEAYAKLAAGLGPLRRRARAVGKPHRPAAGEAPDGSR